MTLPAVVTILDLATAAAASTGMWLEVSFTTGSVATTNRLSLQQIMSTNLGALPTGGATGQLLTKSSGSDFATQWSSISSLVTVSATSSLQLSGSTTIALALASVAGLSVLGTNTSATTIPLPITASTGAQVLRANDAGTGVAFGAINLASAAAVTGILPGANQSATNLATTGAGGVQGVLTVPNGGSGTSTLTAFGVLFGNGTSTIGITAAGTTGWPLVGQGTAVAAAFTTLGVLGGGIGISNYTIGDLLYASATTTLSRLAAATSGALLASQGTSAAAAWSTAPIISGPFRVMSNTAAPASGTAAYLMSATSALGIYFCTGLPSVIAATGSICIRVDGSSATTRLYSNVNGSTTWTSFVATG